MKENPKTILTDDEMIAAVGAPAYLAAGRAVEAAVLAKLAQQADRQRVPDWRPIETAPHGEVVLLWSSRQKVDLDDFGRFAIYNQPRYTHWMPLPTGPAAAPEAPAQEGKQ